MGLNQFYQFGKDFPDYIRSGSILPLIFSLTPPQIAAVQNWSGFLLSFPHLGCTLPSAIFLRIASQPSSKSVTLVTGSTPADSGRSDSQQQSNSVHFAPNLTLPANLISGAFPNTQSIAPTPL
jgi:hypothetical protein